MLACAALSLTGCDVASLFDSDDEDSGNGGGSGTAPGYVGAYSGTMDVSNLETGTTAEDQPATLAVTFVEATGTVDLRIGISSAALPGGSADVEADGCSPGPSTVICSELGGSTLHDFEFSFTSSTASGRVRESTREPDDTFTPAWGASGSLSQP